MGRRGTPSPLPGEGPTVRTSEIRGGDMLTAAYYDGPFPGAPVAPFPPALVELYERQTSVRFDARALATYERIRAFLGYQGIEMTDALQAAQRLTDDYVERRDLDPIRPESKTTKPTATPTRTATATLPATALPIDPRDLGSD